ncbi:glycosyltransferase [candidate division FCPU426 bacterium]|nr:glycosyltransferase [candidate division FCPU426 bacterium]
MMIPAGRTRFSVILPAFNEAGHLAKNIAETAAVMNALGESYELIIVDDCSQDNTAEIIRGLERQHANVRGVVLNENQGKGHALRAGCNVARGELVFFLDADLELHPKQFPLFLELMHRHQADVVIGSKRHPDSVLDYPWRRRVMSTVYFFLVKILFGLPVRDTQTGIKLFRREVLAVAFPKMLVKKYAFDLELLVLANHYHYRIAEAPVEVHYKAKLGHIRPRDVFKIWWDTMAVFYRLYILHYYDKKGMRGRDQG